MGIGAPIGAAALTLANDLAGAVFGVALLITVIAGLIILTNIGGRGVQQHVRGWFTTIFWGFLLSGGAKVIVSGAQKIFALGGATGG